MLRHAIARDRREVRLSEIGFPVRLFLNHPTWGELAQQVLAETRNECYTSFNRWIEPAQQGRLRDKGEEKVFETFSQIAFGNGRNFLFGYAVTH
jgi:hypothetical protein